MRFYTNVQMVGDNFLVRGYENGRHFMTREKFYPTLFVPSKKVRLSTHASLLKAVKSEEEENVSSVGKGGLLLKLANWSCQK